MERVGFWVACPVHKMGQRIEIGRDLANWLSMSLLRGFLYGYTKDGFRRVGCTDACQITVNHQLVGDIR